jgi:nucleoside-diphosphate-sugar epimerase
MRIFVAGATGALGHRVVPLLIEAGHEVTAVGRTPEKRQTLDRQGARAVEVDLFDPSAVRDAVGDHDVICNLATAVPRGARSFLPWSWRQMARIRRRVSSNLVNGALAGSRVQLVIQESFAPIYAAAGDRWVDEAAPVRPALYNRSALVAERNADRFTGAGRAGVVLRFGLLYGPGDAMTQQMIDLVRRGWFPLFGRSDGFSSWAHHEDAARAVVAALGAEAGVYNVVEDQPMRRSELANGIAQLLGVPPSRFPPRWATMFGGVVGPTIARSLRISNRKLRQATGWSPRYSTTLEGIAEIIRRSPASA